MELNGALLNRCLSREARLAGRLAVDPSTPREPAEVAKRAGAVRAAILHVLAEADAPMRACEIHAAAETHAGIPLSSSTVKDYLHKQARRDAGLLRRVGHGMYEAG
jgi:hypothetical protein